MRLLLLLLVVPLVEIGLFIMIGDVVGLWPTLLIVVITAIIGAALLRTQGLRVFVEIHQSAAQGRDPAIPLLHGVMIFVSALLLLTPGFFTDAIGFALLFPRIRDLVISIGRAAIIANAGTFAEYRQRGRPDPEHVIIEGQAHDVDGDGPRH